jgi:RNA polymerase sigma factor (sigma-70 family)
MFRNGTPREMKPAELEEARLGFNQYLRRKGYSPQFIERHGEELLATAAVEYSRKLAEGAEIENAPGWLITCASRRTKNLVHVESRDPRLVSTERAPTVVDDDGQSPEEVALEEDRFRKVREAVEQLSEDERRLLELAYFEGYAVREAARKLDWHPSKAQRCHRTARKHLHQLLGVDSLDQLEIEVGLAAYLVIAAGSSSGLLLRPNMEVVVDTAGRLAAGLWARAQDLARRLPVGGGAESSAGAALQSGSAQLAGVCVTAAATACLASGVVGPGIGGLLGGGAPPSKAPKRQQSVASQSVDAQPLLQPRPQPRISAAPSPPVEHARTPRPRPSAAQHESPSTRRTRRATRAVSSQTIESAAAPEASSESVEAEPVAESSAPSSSSSSASSTSSPSATEIASEQFGP